MTRSVSKRKAEISDALARVAGEVWAMEPAALNNLVVQMAQMAESGQKPTDPVAQRPTMFMMQGNAGQSVAVIPIVGVIRPTNDAITRRMGGTALSTVVNEYLTAINNQGVGQIVFYFDTPGGSVAGLADASDVIRANMNTKPTFGVIGPLCASAGYWLASTLPTLRANQDSLIGSIGVRMLDYSAFRLYESIGVDIDEVHYGARKIDGSPLAPMTAERHAAFQEQVDTYGMAFVNHVAQSRGVSPETVRAEYGDGKVFPGSQAKARGMIDDLIPMFSMGTPGGTSADTQTSTGPAATVTIDPDYLVSALTLTFPNQSNHSASTIAAIEDTIAASVGSAAHGPISEAAIQTAIEEQNPMAISAKVKSALFATGFTQQHDAPDAVCEAALSGFYKAKGATQPTEESAILGDLAGSLRPAQATAAPSTAPAPAPSAMSRDEYLERKATLEAKATLINAGRSTPLIDAAMVQSALDADDARRPIEAIEKEWAAKIQGNLPTPSISVTQTGSGQDRFAADAVQALLHTATNGKKGEKNAMTGMPGHRIAYLSLETAGVNVPKFADAQYVAEQALAMGQTFDQDNRRHITGEYGIGAAGPVNRPADFPNVMAQAMRLIMEDAAASAPTTFELWADRIPDAETNDISSIGGFGVIDDLDDHVDGDDVKERKMTEESKGWIQVTHKANDIALTWLMLADAQKFQNFLRMIRDLAQAGKKSLNRQMIGFLGGNVVLIDGVALFDNAHQNLVASGGAPSETNLRENAKLHHVQKAPGSTTISGVDPTIVLVPKALHITAATAFKTILNVNGTPVANVETAQAYFKDNVTVIADPELDNYSLTAWYSLVDPTITGLRSFVYRYRAGYGETGRVTEYMDPRKRARVYGVDFVAGAAVAKHRGVVKNPG